MTKTKHKSRNPTVKRGLATPELWTTKAQRNRWGKIVEAFKLMKPHHQITIDPKAFDRTQHAMAVLVRKAIEDHAAYHGHEAPKVSVRRQKDGTIALCTSRTVEVGLTGRFRTA